MESAIPAHLKIECPRHQNLKAGYLPPFAASVARFGSATARVVMAYFGLQYQGDAPDAATVSLSSLEGHFARDGGPGHWDRASFIDERQFTNVVSVAYWDDFTTFTDWFAAARESWVGGSTQAQEIGTFVEILSPSVRNYETLFSSLGRPEGIAELADGMSDAIFEHAYWGAMRDRLPRSQDSAMAPEGAPQLVREGLRAVIKPHSNLCLIRSGQDWSDTDSNERDMYLNDVEPIFRAGMEFLATEGLAIGCYSNRYMVVLDKEGRFSAKSYGMSWWNSLADLEAWAEKHPTHVRIFGAAMKYLGTLGPRAKLRLYHEVTVANKDEQYFEYYNCHDDTGMLRSVKTPP